MKNYTAKAGKHLIQILMFSMYNDQRIIYREYIQNAYDSIVRAVKTGVLSKVKDGIVDIKIDPQSKRITIRDNGTGIPLKEVPQRLLNIADSKKDGVSSAGQYGIGRLAGAGYCQWLKFKTSSSGENHATIITFDVNFANQIINDSSDDSSATEIIDAVTKMEVVSEDEDSHYFEVTLEGVSQEYKDLLNPNAISEYLKEIAPVDYSITFRNALLNPGINSHSDTSFKDLCDDVRGISICVNDSIAIKKRYGLTIEGTGDEIDSLAFFKIETESNVPLAWGWYAVTPFTKQIPISDQNRGIRLRKHNIQLGTSDLLNKYFGEARGNNYFYGEIFAIHPNLRPNSDRSGLAPTPESEILFDNLRLIFKDLGKLYQVANTAKNAVKKVSLAVDKLTSGIETDTSQINAEIKSAEAELTKIENSSNAQSPVAKRVIELHKSKATVKKAEVNSDKKAQPKRYKLGSLLPHLNESAVVTDIFEPLEKKLTDNEILLLRKVFNYMSLACPAAYKSLLEQLKRHAINQLLL